MMIELSRKRIEQRLLRVVVEHASQDSQRRLAKPLADTSSSDSPRGASAPRLVLCCVALRPVLCCVASSRVVDYVELCAHLQGSFSSPPLGEKTT